uniref:Uncharacterized protein n=1 Tax=Rhizophora mucronata TaxID=61149 RepID=A0A2P2MCS2_RHIMU
MCIPLRSKKHPRNFHFSKAFGFLRFAGFCVPVRFKLQSINFFSLFTEKQVKSSLSLYVIGRYFNLIYLYVKNLLPE